MKKARENLDKDPRVFDGTYAFSIESMAGDLKGYDVDLVWVTPQQIRDVVKELDSLRKTIVKLAARVP